MKKLWAFIMGIFRSKWFGIIIGYAMQDLKDTLEHVGQEGYDQIKAKVIEVAAMPITGTEKAKLVRDYALGLFPALATSALNRLLEDIVGNLKDAKIIK